MADDSDLFDAIPPSPIATSTQIPQSSFGAVNFPPFPAFPQFPSFPDDVFTGPAAPPQDQGSGQLDLSPIPGTSQVQRARPQSGRSNRRISGGVLDNWIARSYTATQPSSPLVTGTAVSTQGQETIQVDDDVVEIEDNSNSGSTISSVSSGTIGRETPVQEIVVDSDTNSTSSDVEVLERPNNPEPPDEIRLLEPGEDVVEGFVREETVLETGQAVTEHGGPAPSGSQGDGAPAVAGSASVVQQLAPSTPSSGLPVQSRLVHSITDSSPADFRSPKRKRVASPQKPVATVTGDQGTDEEDGECCPICFEPWTTSGNHRLSSLKCGHLFGQSCIEKWLKGQGGKCPHCNAKAKRQDIRILYAKTIKALDTTEKEQALRDLEKERELRRKAEMDGAQMRLQYQVAIEENNKMRLEIETLKSQLRRAGSGLVPSTSTSRATDILKGASQTQIGGQFALDRTIKIWEAGNCRVMAYSPSLATLVVSQPSSSPLFPGYGVKKISALDFKTSQYLTIHSKAIRDVSFHPSVEDGMLLSCGLDKKVKMTSLISNAVVQSYDTPMPAWSCVWNADNRNYMYAGLINGKVLEFDIRNTDEAVSELNKEGSRSPVASLLYMNADQSADFRPGGLLVGQMDRVSFYEKTSGGDWRPHLLPLEGTLTSLSFEPQTRHVLASYRPTANYPTVRHLLCEMFTRNISSDPTVIDNVCSCNVIHTFHGGRTQTILSRSTVLPHPGDNNRLLVCSGDETNSSVHMWDSGTGQMTQRLLTGGMALDLCTFRIHNSTYLAALTDKHCKMFKWT